MMKNANPYKIQKKYIWQRLLLWDVLRSMSKIWESEVQRVNLIEAVVRPCDHREQNTMWLVAIAIVYLKTLFY